ncbi:MAG: peptidase, partial [Proteobacteria bacterium]
MKSDQRSRTPWTHTERAQWLSEQQVKRSYRDEVVQKIEALKANYSVTQYHALSIDPARYPLYTVQSKKFSAMKKTILITGGVHGYETSGVQGALSYLAGDGLKDQEEFNLIVAPCISPWAYETINRWNPQAIDPNRSFKADSPAEESAQLMSCMLNDLDGIDCHIDLHETTDTDNTVFRPALAARDGKEQPFSPIPDGFYTVGDTENPQLEFQKAIIESVKKITHIAPAE